MSEAHQILLDLLAVEKLEMDLFRGTGQGGETPTRIFGGQVIGQALAAAYQTVPERLCHSLHAYFIRAGDPDIPVVYQVDRARDGGSFTTRRVVAIQNGKQILNMSASFQIAESGWSHQHPMPDVQGPDGLEDAATQAARIATKVPEKYRAMLLRPSAIDIREVAPRDFFNPAPSDDKNHVWFRMSAAAGSSPQMQQCLLAYASDLRLLGAALRPHGLSWFDRKFMAASLDHAMYFHAPTGFEDWHLYAMDSPWSGGGRGFNRGAIFDRDGKLIASTAQEGLIRPV